MKKYILLFLALLFVVKNQAMNFGNDYEIVGVTENEKKREIIDRAYHQKILWWHPNTVAWALTIQNIPVFSSLQLNYLEKTKDKRYSNDEKMKLTRKYIALFLAKNISDISDQDVIDNFQNFHEKQFSIIDNAFHNISVV